MNESYFYFFVFKEYLAFKAGSFSFFLVHIKFIKANKLPLRAVILKRVMATNDISVWYGRGAYQNL